MNTETKRTSNWIAVVAALLLTTQVGADWPQYRGVERDGIDRSSSLAASWPEDGPPVEWRLPIGGAFSQLTVRGNAVFTATSDDEKEYVVSLYRQNGKERWRAEIGEVFQDQFGQGPRATPTLAGERLFALSSKGQVIALSAEDGRKLWSVDLLERFGASVPRFGFVASPLVVDDQLVIAAGGPENASLVSLGIKSGETRWTALSGGAAYSSPIVFELGGSRQIVLIRGKTLTALSLTGDLLWTHELIGNAIAMPIQIGKDRLFVSMEGDTGCAMLQLAQDKPGSFQVVELWTNRDMRNHFNSSVVLGDLIFGFDNATLKCLSATTGELMWARRGFGKGSLVASGGHLVVLSDRGRVMLVEATGESYRQAGAFQALEGKSWTAPSLAGGRLYLRNLTEMTCLDLRG